MKFGIPIGLGYFAVSISLGIAARNAGLTGFQAAVTYLIRILPLTLIKKPIKSRFVRSFLYYVPYVTLSVMAFSAMIYATGNLISGVAAFAVGFLVAWLSKNLLLTAVSSAGMVLVIELLGIGSLL